MQTKHSTVLTTLQGVQGFMDRNAQALGVLNTSDSRRALDAVEQTLSQQAVTQASGARTSKAEVARQRVLRNTLKVKFLYPIASIAAAQLSQTPDFTDLKLPKGVNTSQKLIAAAVSMGEAAAKYAPTFIGAGMPSTFLQDLQAAADELKAGLAAKGAARAKRVSASSGLVTAAAQAHRVVKQLDSLMEAQLATNPTLLAEWKSVKRFAGKSAAITATTLDSGRRYVARLRRRHCRHGQHAGQHRWRFGQRVGSDDGGNAGVEHDQCFTLQPGAGNGVRLEAVEVR